MTRSELVERIAKEKAEAKKAGAYHRHDLHKHIMRMERELRDYDRFRGGDALSDARVSLRTG